MTRRTVLFLTFGLVTMMAAPAHADDLYRRGAWSALASDPTARAVGDALTVVIYESASASNSAQSGGRRSLKLSGQAASGAGSTTGRAELSGGFDDAGQTGRSGKLLAQISVTVDGVLPNGDLHVSGAQTLNIGGERTFIRLAGRVRRADIAGDNTVTSSRLADAAIDYDGAGFVSRRGAPSRVARIFDWLGLL